MKLAQFSYFDGHNDVLLKLASAPDLGAAVDAFVHDKFDADIDFQRAQQGGMSGGVFAVFAPPPQAPKEIRDPKKMSASVGISQKEAQQHFYAQAAAFDAVVAELGDKANKCLSGRDLELAVAQDQFAMLLHVEGAEAVGEDLAFLTEMHGRGVRSIGPLWSRENIFGVGVPFKFPASPDIGPGLSEVGKEFVREANRLRMQIDLSHLNEKGFWDVAAISDAPLVATHSNVYEICNSPRNLTQKQLEAIAESGGIVGLCLATYFLRPDGNFQADAGFEDILRHLDAMIDILGEDGVAIGSDFDGARLPSVIGDVSGIPKLFDAMLVHGYGASLVAKIASENWIAHLKRTLD